jgi:pimeloyl-ACP methyl ester carboxylesterase
VAAAFAASHPDHVERLVLVDAAGYFMGPVKREEMAFLNPSTLAGARETLNRVFADKQLVTDAVVERFFIDKLHAGDSYTIERFIDSVIRGEDELNDRLKTIKAPTLVTWGREDSLVPVAVAEVFVREIPGAQKVIFDNCGHAPHFECLPAFLDALNKFLSAP